MKLNITPRIQADQSLLRELKDHAQQVNALSEGRMSARYNAVPAAPTTGQFTVGDFVPNSAPVEQGAPGARYVIEGWMCSGSNPLAFLQKRFLTGN